MLFRIHQGEQIKEDRIQSGILHRRGRRRLKKNAVWWCGLEWTILKRDTVLKSLHGVQNLLVPQRERYFFTGWATVSFSIINFLQVIIKYTHSSPFAVVTIRNVQCKSNFAQVGTECTYGRLRMHTQGSPTEIETPAHWNLTGGNRNSPHPPHALW